MELDLAKGAILVLVGLVAGTTGGLLGIGGSVIFIPAMDQLLAGGSEGLYVLWAATALICNVFVGAGAAVGHYRNRRVIPKVVKMIVPLGVAAAVVGVLAANFLDAKVLWLVFGAVVCYMIHNNLRKLLGKVEPAALSAGAELDPRKVNVPRASAVALPTGFLAGMLGIGGGIYSVPSQQIFLHMPQKNAIANSSATMIVFCAIAAVVRNVTMTLPEGFTHWDPVRLAALLVPSAIIGAYVGGHLTHKLPDRLVRSLFVGFLLWTAYKCLFVNAGVAQLVDGWFGG